MLEEFRRTLHWPHFTTDKLPLFLDHKMSPKYDLDIGMVDSDPFPTVLLYQTPYVVTLERVELSDTCKFLPDRLVERISKNGSFGVHPARETLRPESTSSYSS